MSKKEELKTQILELTREYYIVIYIFTKPFLRIHRGLRKLFGLSPTLCFQDESMRVLLKKGYSIK